jgi:lysophospholipase L1-like esterase
VSIRVGFRLFWVGLAAVLAAAIWVGIAVAHPGPGTGVHTVTTTDAHPGTGTATGGAYLALGDSVAFGYVPSQAVPVPNYSDVHSFVGYPEFLAQRLRERLSNASCPGETTASFLDADAQSNGCENSVGSSVGYRDLYPLKVEYQGTQMQYALGFLAHEKHTQLITIDIGANDVFVCQETTPDQCSSQTELAAVAQEIGTNLAAIITALRGTGYAGPIVVLTYYSLNYADPAQVAGTLFLDSVIESATQAAGGTIANGFTAFAVASAAYGGDPCSAGLLIKLPNGTCDVHPTAEGQQVLAAAIASALGD